MLRKESELEEFPEKGDDEEKEAEGEGEEDAPKRNSTSPRRDSEECAIGCFEWCFRMVRLL